MKSILNSLRWGFLILAVPMGIGMCWIPWSMDAKHRAWGCPIPMVVWEKTEDSWADFPCPVAFVVNPAIMLLFAGVFFWLAGLRIKRMPNQASEVTARKFAEPQG